jgi:hypothetical protein
MGTLSVEKQEKLEADAAKAERKAEKKAEQEAKKKEVSCLDSPMSDIKLTLRPRRSLSSEQRGRNESIKRISRVLTSSALT